MPSESRRELPLVALAVALVLGLLALRGWDLSQFSRRQMGLLLEERESGLFVRGVLPGYPAAEAGLRAGDRLLTVRGQPVARSTEVPQVMRGWSLGEPVSYRVERDGAWLAIEVTPGTPFPLFTFAVTVLTALCYLLIGPLALAKRPGYLRARLLFWLTAAVAAEIALPVPRFTSSPWVSVGLLLNGVQMAVELHLASVIPERQAWLRRFPRAIPGYYLLGLGSTGVVAAALALIGAGYPLLPVSGRALYQGFTSVFLPVWALWVLALLGRQAFTYPEMKGRQQAGLVALGVLPWALIVFASRFGLLQQWISVHWQELAWNGALLLYPLAVFVILFREAADQERILLDLTIRVQRASSVAEISRVVGTDLHSAFHPKSTHVFYRERHSRDLNLGHSSGMRLEEEQIPESSVLLRLVEAHGKAVDYPADLTGLPPEESRWLDRLDARLLVPLRGRDKRLLGLLLLGPKKSEEPYTQRDRKLLHALSGQMALVYENARLEEHVDESRRLQREVLSRLEEQDLQLMRECPTCGRCYDASEPRCPADGCDLQPTLPVERVISGRYRLERRLDRGGMGAIYEAHDLHLERQVAVKILHGALAGEDARRRFETEARLTAALRHRNVVTVHDYGTTESGAAFLVMELLRGRTLGSLLGERSPLPLATVAHLFDEICEGVKAAHREQIIHRDLKPANIFIADQPDGVAVKILDFGVAKLRSDAMRSSAGVTTPGTLVGTFNYMAPEQLAGERADERSDVFALAVMATEALIGRRPFVGDGPAELLCAMGQPLELAPEWPADGGLAQVLRIALARQRESRFPSVVELQQALIPAIRSAAEPPPALNC